MLDQFDDEMDLDNDPLDDDDDDFNGCSDDDEDFDD